MGSLVYASIKLLTSNKLLHKPLKEHVIATNVDTKTRNWVYSMKLEKLKLKVFAVTKLLKTVMIKMKSSTAFLSEPDRSLSRSGDISR